MPNEGDGEIREMLAPPSSAEDANGSETATAVDDQAPPSGQRDDAVTTAEAHDAPPQSEPIPEADASQKRKPAEPAADGQTTTPKKATDGLSEKEAEAIARLAGEKKPEQPKPGAEKAPKAAVTGETKPEAKAPTDKSKPAKAVALTAEDEAALDDKSRKAFASMRTELKTAKQQADDLKELSEQGRYWTDLFVKHQAVDDLQEVDEAAHVGVVRIQAALNRAGKALDTGARPHEHDLQLIAAADQALSDSMARIGLKRTGGDAPAVEPYSGELSEDLKFLVQSGIPEARVRMLAALEQAEKTPKRQAPPRAAAPPPRQQLPPQRQAQRTPAPTSAPSTEQQLEVKQYAALTRAHLEDSGVPRVQHELHLLKHLMPIIIGELVEPNMPQGKSDPIEVFNSASPSVRHELVIRAQKRFEAKQKQREQVPAPRPPNAPARVPRPLTQRDMRRVGPTRTTDQNAPVSEEERRMAFLAGEG